MTELTLTRQGKVVRLAGPLHFATVAQALKLLRHELAQGPVLTLDLAGVSHCDSSAVALMLEMRRQGLAEILHMPAEMAAIVRACQLEPLFAPDASSSRTAAGSNHDEHS